MKHPIRILAIAAFIVICAIGSFLALTEEDPAVPPTCTSTGLTAGKHLSVFSITTKRQEIVPALGHDVLHHEGVDPTCLESGYLPYDTCSRCSYSTFCELPALGHKLNYYQAEDATCTVGGHSAYETCTRCDYSTYSELPALGHEFSGDHCKRCGLDYALCSELESIGEIGNAKVSNDNVGYNFYKSQNSTGAYSSSNCGPTCAYMAGKWANEDFSASVEEIRNTNVKPAPHDNGWFPQTIAHALDIYGIDNSLYHMPSTAKAAVDLKNALDEGKLLIICHNCKDIREDGSISGVFGNAHYAKDAGHFVVVKGYWVLDGVMYFEVYDPNLPTDYQKRIGGPDRTRYYDAGELINSAFNRNRYIVVVSRATDQ